MDRRLVECQSRTDRQLAVRGRVVEHLHRLADHRVFVLGRDIGEVIAVGAAILLAGHDSAVGFRALELAAVADRKSSIRSAVKSPSGPFMWAFVVYVALCLSSS